MGGGIREVRAGVNATVDEVYAQQAHQCRQDIRIYSSTGQQRTSVNTSTINGA